MLQYNIDGYMKLAEDSLDEVIKALDRFHFEHSVDDDGIVLFDFEGNERCAFDRSFLDAVSPCAESGHVSVSVLEDGREENGGYTAEYELGGEIGEQKYRKVWDEFYPTIEDYPAETEVA